ncbi:MAG: hypothetical protein K6G42_02830, partial [Lachnospiraceae bacterium]|nr:hypothetical protein [Lachnospiraceae bacterium]
MKRSRGLSFKLAIVFLIFMIVTLTLCGITTYLSQMSIYRKQCQRDITNVASYLASLAAAEGEDFIRYK